MTREECRKTAIQALEAMRGDDLARARSAAKHHPLDKEWGQSGKTLGSIIADYEEHAAQVDAAIAWVRGA